MFPIKTIAITGFCALASLVAVSAAHADPIVTNGGFTNGLSGWTVFDPTNFPGINTTPGRGVTTVVTNGTDATGYGDKVPSFNGSTNAAYFVDDNAVEKISQMVTLNPYTTYTLSYGLFATASGANNPYSFTIEDSITGVLNSFTNSRTVTQVPVGKWTAESDMFTTDGGSSYTLMFGFDSGSTPAKDVLLTDVAIPEPASMALLGAGLIGTGVAARRRKSALTAAAC